MTERRRGKLTMAKRHNWLDPLGPVALALGGIDVIVTDSFRYFGKGGRISTKTTDLTLNVTTEAWESTYEYDDLGQVTSMTYPRALSWPYNTKAPDRSLQNSYKQGYLTAVAGYAPEITYQYGGMIREVDFQINAKWTVDVNDSDKLARPHRIRTSGVASGYQSGDMFYDGVGNVTTIGTLTYRYDRLSRLTSGQAPLNGVGLTQTASYDPYGNLLNLVTNGTAETMSPSASTNRLANATYDPAGNLTNINLGGNIKYGYDGLNAQASVQTTTKSRLQFYDANDDRIWTWDCPIGVCAGTHEAWTLRGLGGEVLRRYEGPNRYETTWKEDYVYRDSTLLAMVQRLEPTGGPTEKVVNVFVDHLGSTRQTFDTANVAIDRFDFYPFGQETAPATTADPVHKFTGHERDAGLSHVKGTVDYMHARMCSPVTGRFLSVDPVKGSIASSQSWNRYSYVLNNPLKYIDPMGLTTATFEDEITVTAAAPDVLYWPNHWAFWLVPSPAKHFDRSRFNQPGGGGSCDAWCQVMAKVGESASAASWLEFFGSELTVFGIGGMLFGRATPAIGPPGGAFLHGELFETTIRTAAGEVGILAEVSVSGRTLTLGEVAIFSTSGNIKNQVGARALLQAQDQVAKLAASDGFEVLHLTGRRSLASSSRNPGSVIDRTIDLSRYK